MPAGFTIKFRVEVKGMGKHIEVKETASSESKTFITHEVSLRNLDGYREKEVKVFYDCSKSDWEYIKIKIVPEHPFNLLSKMAIAKFLKTCKPDAFMRLGLPNVVLWITAASIAYFAILISRKRDHATEDFFEKARIIFQ